MDNPESFTYKLIATLCVALSGVYARPLLRVAESPHVVYADAVAVAGALAFCYVVLAEGRQHVAT